MSDVTRILSKIESGDPAAAGQLLPLVYEELRKLATAKLAQEKPGQTLQATALVHEAYLRLVDTDENLHWNSRGHFFGAAAEAMRRILVDQARRKLAVRHGGQSERVTDLRDLLDAGQDPEVTVAIDELLDRLAAAYGRQGQVAKMRVYLQLTFVEIAKVLGLSPDTVETDWSYARAWLKREWQQV